MKRVYIFTLPMRCFDWYVWSFCLLESTLCEHIWLLYAILPALSVCTLVFLFSAYWRTNQSWLKMKISYDKLTQRKWWWYDFWFQLQQCSSLGCTLFSAGKMCMCVVEMNAFEISLNTEYIWIPFYFTIHSILCYFPEWMALNKHAFAHVKYEFLNRTMFCVMI